jgi:uncharacterized protein YkwD
VNHERISGGVALSGVARSSRRRLLTLLAALPAALGFSFVMERESVTAWKEQAQRQRQGGGGGYSPDREERAFLDLINDYRRKNGARNLSLQNQLGAAAEHHSQDMAKKNYFSHKLSNGDSPEKHRTLRLHQLVLHWENIAAGHETAKAVMNAWKSSRKHDRNMRNKNFTEIGIGRAYNKNSKYGWYWTTTFGSR